MSIEHEMDTFTPASGPQPTDIKHIVRDPLVYGGLPCIEGHRIAVHDIAEYVQQGFTAEQIVAEVYPHLTLVEVYAALLYYYEHQEEIDREIAEDIADIKKRAAENRSPFAQQLRQHILERRRLEGGA